MSNLYNAKGKSSLAKSEEKECAHVIEHFEIKVARQLFVAEAEMVGRL